MGNRNNNNGQQFSNQPVVKLPNEQETRSTGGSNTNSFGQFGNTSTGYNAGSSISGSEGGSSNRGGSDGWTSNRGGSDGWTSGRGGSDGWTSNTGGFGGWQRGEGGYTGDTTGRGRTTGSGISRGLETADIKALRDYKFDDSPERNRIAGAFWDQQRQNRESYGGLSSGNPMLRSLNLERANADAFRGFSNSMGDLASRRNEREFGRLGTLAGLTSARENTQTTENENSSRNTGSNFNNSQNGGTNYSDGRNGSTSWTDGRNGSTSWTDGRNGSTSWTDGRNWNTGFNNSFGINGQDSRGWNANQTDSQDWRDTLSRGFTSSLPGQNSNGTTNALIGAGGSIASAAIIAAIA